MLFVPHRKHTPQLPVTGIALLLLYIDDVRSSQNAQLWAFTAYYGGWFYFYFTDQKCTTIVLEEQGRQVPGLAGQHDTV
jgi:hypothetical protein